MFLWTQLTDHMPSIVLLTRMGCATPGVKNENMKKLSKILKKTEDITAMTLEEYKIYIDDHTKKSKYPDISQ